MTRTGVTDNRDIARPSGAKAPAAVGASILALTVAAALGCGGSSTAPSRPPESGTFTMRGVVTDARTENVIAGASITFTRSGTVTTTTNFDGEFQSSVITGETSVRATADGYEPEARTLNVTADSTVNFALRAQPGATAPCGTAANRGNRLLPMLSNPLRGSFPHASFFDHDLPVSPGGIGEQLTSCGDRVTNAESIDGHDGHDWVMPAGTPVHAAAPGEVTFAGTVEPFACAALGRTVSDQLMVEILHPPAQVERFNTTYVHLSRVDVQVGQTVSEGQVIGLSGNTGCSTQPQLHFGVARLSNTNDGEPAQIDPYGWEGSGADPWARHPQGAGSFWLWKPGQAPLLQQP